MDEDSPAIRNSPVKVEDHKIAAFISSLKRPATDIACGTAAKKLRPSSDEGGVKNAIMLLNELVPRLQYTMTAESGPSHSPTFTMTVEYCGQVHKIRILIFSTILNAFVTACNCAFSSEWKLVLFFLCCQN